MKIYFCPALVDWVVFLVLFAVLYGAGLRELSVSQYAWLGGIFQLAYLACSLLAGVLLTRRSARAWLLCSVGSGLAVALFSLYTTDYPWLLVAMGALGVTTAMFFNSFQTFMRGESPPGGLARSVGLYTLAWSAGSGLGHLSAGMCYRFGTLVLAIIAAVVCAVVFVFLARYRTRPLGEISADEHVEQGSQQARAVDPRYVGVAWVVIFAAMFVQRPIITFYPALSGKYGHSAAMAGIPMFLLLFVQGVSGALFMYCRDWLYRRTPLLVSHLAGALVLLALWRYPQYWMVLAGVTALGIYSGFAFFSAVYYAGNSGRRSFNTGVNEFLVGVGSFAGLFACQAWMKHSGNDQGLYLVCALALAIAAALQLTLVSGKNHNLITENS